MSGKSEKQKLKLLRVGVIMLGLQIIFSIGFALYVYNYDILPTLHFAVLCGGLLLLCLLSFIFFLGRTIKKWKNIVGTIISIIAIAVIAAGFYYIHTTFRYMENMGSDASHETINIIALKDSGIENINDIKQLDETNVIGVRELVDEENTRYALEQIYNEAGKTFDTKSYTDFSEMVNALNDGEIKLMVVNDKYMDMILNDHPDIYQNLSVVHTIQNETTSQTSSSYVTQPFTVYFRGLDTRDGSFEYGNADVNIVATINPVTKQILLTSVPRDYYVALYADASKMDKLTHAGAYGMDCSIETLEGLLDTQLDYYVIVNFESVVNIVDALGGVDVYSMYTFDATRSERTFEVYHYEEGMNTLNGEQALSFVRERYNLPEGDKDRGKNQEALIAGIINKIISPSIIQNYTAVMDAITSNVSMNIPTEMITALIKMQLEDMSSWDIVSTSLDGYSDYSTTYSYPSEELYVMKPYEDTVTEAIQKINNIKNPGQYIQSVIKSSPVLVQ